MPPPRSGAPAALVALLSARSARGVAAGARLAAVADARVFEAVDRLAEPWVFYAADTVDELYQLLVLTSSAQGNPSDAFVPLCVFQQFHKIDQTGAATTALLLLTDRRWRRATGRLVREIVASGLVPSDHLDLLARAFLAAESHLYWEAPDHWFDGAEIVIELAASQGGPTAAYETPGEDGGPVVVRRDVWPPLRRKRPGKSPSGSRCPCLGK